MQSKCYGSTAVSKAASLGSTPRDCAADHTSTPALVAEVRVCNSGLARRLHCVENAQVHRPYGVVKYKPSSHWTIAQSAEREAVNF